MNHRSLSVLLAAGIAATGLGLTACHQKQASPEQQMKQGADDFGAGAVKKASRAGQVVADSAITMKVKTQFATDESLTGSDIQVQTTGGIVTLSGTVTSNALRKRAGQLASAIDGVKSVSNDIKVAPQN